MIDAEIQVLFFKLLVDPEGFTLMDMRELERLLDLYHRAKSMGLDMQMIDDQAVILNEGI